MHLFKRGFTLAETLITIAIIGIIAVIAIPPLVNNYQKSNYVNMLKKTYSEISQTFKQYMSDQGVSSLEQTELFSSEYNFEKLEEIMTKYLKAKKCKDTECQIDELFLNYSSAYDPHFSPYLKIEASGKYTIEFNSFRTIDGKFLEVGLYSLANCTPNYTKISNLKGLCLLITVDVNGFKHPNQFGKDYLYGLIVGTDGNLYPYYGQEYAKYWQGSNWTNSYYYWKKAKPDACGEPDSSVIPDFTIGEGCVARIMEENWTMDY